MAERRTDSMHGAYAYVFLFALRLTEIYWVIYLRGKGLSFAAVGLLETVFHLASFSGEVPTGMLADRFGRRASLSVGRILAACAAALTLYARNWTVLAASFALAAISYTCHSGAFDAWVYDSLADDRKSDFTRLIGRMNSAYLVGTALAGCVAALLARVSLDWLFRASIAVDLAAAAIAMSLPEGDPERRARPPGEPVGGLASDIRTLYRSLRAPDLRILLVLWGVSGAIATSASFYGQSVLKEALVPVEMIGLVITAANLLAVIPSFHADRIQRRFGRERSVAAGSLLLPSIVAAMCVVPGSMSLPGRLAVVGLYVTLSIVNEALYPLFSDALNSRTDSANRAAVLSSGSMVFSVAMMVIFPLMGYVGDRLGLRSGIASGAAVAAACLVPLALALTPRRGSERPR